VSVNGGEARNSGKRKHSRSVAAAVSDDDDSKFISVSLFISVREASARVVRPCFLRNLLLICGRFARLPARHGHSTYVEAKDF